MNHFESIGTIIKDLLPAEATSDKSTYRGQHFEIVSGTAFLLGIDKRFFEDENQNLQLDIYKKFSLNRAACIIRNLCMVRTQLEHNFSKIRIGIQQQFKSITQMPEYISPKALSELSDIGIDLYRFRQKPTPFLIEVNREIQNRINNCRNLFPDWLAWD
ncbi:MAG: hypothetical protein IJ679_08945, partial [Lachnospiraceae bacterium]|nr:hypothetical protein [Lachnospiraceae bacterium]